MLELEEKVKKQSEVIDNLITRVTKLEKLYQEAESRTCTINDNYNEFDIPPLPPSIVHFLPRSTSRPFPTPPDPSGLLTPFPMTPSGSLPPLVSLPPFVSLPQSVPLPQYVPLPQSVPLPLKKKNNFLPSTEIDGKVLLPSSGVIAKYGKFRHECHAGKLAVKLAKESFFGEEVLCRYTVMGCRQQARSKQFGIGQATK